MKSACRQPRPRNKSLRFRASRQVIANHAVQGRDMQRIRRLSSKGAGVATKHDLMAKMALHIGAGKGIRGEDLARELGINSRRLRELISLVIEQDGVAICGHPSTGYFVASNAQELQDTIDFHKGRALHELSKASQLSKTPLPDLIGQLRLRN